MPRKPIPMTREQHAQAAALLEQAQHNLIAVCNLASAAEGSSYLEQVFRAGHGVQALTWALHEAWDLDFGDDPVERTPYAFWGWQFPARRRRHVPSARRRWAKLPRLTADMLPTWEQLEAAHARGEW
jgi:hypothetical protein